MPGGCHKPSLGNVIPAKRNEAEISKTRCVCVTMKVSPNFWS